MLGELKAAGVIGEPTLASRGRRVALGKVNHYVADGEIAVARLRHSVAVCGGCRPAARRTIPIVRLEFPHSTAAAIIGGPPPSRYRELSMDLQLKGKRALVTGSTAGIGYAIAAALAREGAEVVINGRTEEGVAKAVQTLKAETGGDVVGFAGDLGGAPAAEALVRAHPQVDILVNNLGIFEPKPFEEIPDSDWRRFFEVNVISGARLARLYLPGMKRANWGRIIFISSRAACRFRPR